MKLPVTQAIVEQVLREAHIARRLRAGSWANDLVAEFRSVPFCGCAVGNLLWEAAGRKADADVVAAAATTVTRVETGYRAICGLHLARGLAKDGLHLNAISCIFEHYYDGSDEGLGRTLDNVRRLLPARFSIDIDGLRALPTWRKSKPKPRAKKRAGKRGRK